MSRHIQEVNGTVERSKNDVNFTDVVSNVTMVKELPLLDERSLLACVVRVISPGIKICCYSWRITKFYYSI
jgi:hypothetical protein